MHFPPNQTQADATYQTKRLQAWSSGVKNGFCFWQGRRRSPEELAWTIVPGMKDREGKTKGGERGDGQTPGGQQPEVVFCPPGDDMQSF